MRPGIIVLGSDFPAGATSRSSDGPSAPGGDLRFGVTRSRSSGSKFTPAEALETDFLHDEKRFLLAIYVRPGREAKDVGVNRGTITKMHAAESRMVMRRSQKTLETRWTCFKMVEREELTVDLGY